MSFELLALVSELAFRRMRTNLTVTGVSDNFSSASPPPPLVILPRGKARHSVGSLCEKSSGPTKWPYSTEKSVAKGCDHRILMASIFFGTPRSIITHCVFVELSSLLQRSLILGLSCQKF